MCCVERCRRKASSAYGKGSRPTTCAWGPTPCWRSSFWSRWTSPTAYSSSRTSQAIQEDCKSLCATSHEFKSELLISRLFLASLLSGNSHWRFFLFPCDWFCKEIQFTYRLFFKMAAVAAMLEVCKRSDDRRSPKVNPLLCILAICPRYSVESVAEPSLEF